MHAHAILRRGNHRACISRLKFLYQYYVGLQVLYTSNPRAPGGPVLRSAPGQALFAGAPA